MIQRYGLTVLGVVFGLLYWPFEALLQTFIFDRGNFAAHLFSHDPNELWMRTLISTAFIGFGWVGQRNLLAQRQLKDRLARKRDRLSQIIDSTYDAYVAIDDQGKVIGWNRSAEGMFGWLKQDVMGKEVAQLIIPESMRVAHRQGMQRYCNSGIGTKLYKPLHIRACHKNGSEFEISMVITPFRAGEKQEFFAFIRGLDKPQYPSAGDSFD